MFASARYATLHARLAFRAIANCDFTTILLSDCLEIYIKKFLVPYFNVSTRLSWQLLPEYFEFFHAIIIIFTYSPELERN